MSTKPSQASTKATSVGSQQVYNSLNAVASEFPKTPDCAQAVMRWASGFSAYVQQQQDKTSTDSQNPSEGQPMPDWMTLDEFRAFVGTVLNMFKLTRDNSKKIAKVEKALTRSTEECSRKFEESAKRQAALEERLTGKFDSLHSNSGGTQTNQESQGDTTTQDTMPSDFKP